MVENYEPSLQAELMNLDQGESYLLKISSSTGKACPGTVKMDKVVGGEGKTES